MRNHKKLTELVRMFWPQSHRRYEKMCVLATTGQLGGPEMSELDAHVAHCESCRSFLESTAQASVQLISILADERVIAPNALPPVGMRARFMSRAAAAGVKINSDPIAYPILKRSPIRFTPRDQSSEAVRRKQARPAGTRFGSLPSFARPALVATAILAIAVAGDVGWKHRPSREGLGSGILARSTDKPTSAVQTADAENSSRIGELEDRKTALEAEKSELEANLVEAASQRNALLENLSSSVEQLAEVTEQAQKDQRREIQEKQDAKARISALQDDVDKLRWQLTASEDKLASGQKQSDELKAKLEGAESELQRQLELKSAGPQIGDLVAARNLHIIDVYDADKGKRQHSFGRVFYVEGKSLVFYVYDLDDPRRLNTNVVFRVWGEKSGMKETTHNLGILHNDDASQGRWTLTFDDAKVLAQINSVFVTVEPANKHYDRPRGQKVLYAFFGSTPNHP